MNKIMLLTAVLIVTGCAGSGKINWDEASQLKPGMTEQEVTSIMGKPYSIASKNDGTDIWVWVHVNLLVGSESMSALMKDGRFIKTVVRQSQ